MHGQAPLNRTVDHCGYSQSLRIGCSTSGTGEAIVGVCEMRQMSGQRSGSLIRIRARHRATRVVRHRHRQPKSGVWIGFARARGPAGDTKNTGGSWEVACPGVAAGGSFDAFGH